MNGYQLTKQYFAFAAANPGATTPGMCALFMWLVEVNNRSRFTQNFFFNAEDAGYACGMQSRKTVWKYLVQLEVAGLVRIVYKSNNQERPSVLSLGCVSGDGLPVAGDSVASCLGSSYGGPVAGSLDSSYGLPVARDYVAGTLVAADELPAACHPDARNSDARDRKLAVGSDVAGDGLQIAKNIVNGHPVESDASSGVWGNWRFYGTRCDDDNLPADGAPHDGAAGLNVKANDAIDDLQGQECVDVNGGLSVSKDAIVSAKDKSAAPNKSAAQACRKQQSKSGKSQSVSYGLPATEHPATRTLQPTVNTPVTRNPSLATQHPVIRKSPPTAYAPATQHPQPATLLRKQRGNTVATPLAHSYKGLNYPNQKNSVNGAHLSFGMMQEPKLNEVSTFFTQHGYTANAAEKAWAHYRQANWHDVQGRPVLNWQQKCRTIWFTPENRIPTTQTRFVQ